MARRAKRAAPERIRWYINAFKLFFRLYPLQNIAFQAIEKSADTAKTGSCFLSFGVVCKIKSMEGALLGLHCKHRAPFEGGTFPPAIKATPLERPGLSSPDLATRWASRAGVAFCNSFEGGKCPPAARATPLCYRLPAIRQERWAVPDGCYGRTRFLNGFRRDNRPYADYHPPGQGGAFDCFRLISESPNAFCVLAWAVRAICSRVGIPTRDCGEFSRP